MSEAAPRKTRRSRYLVNRRLQLTMTAQLLGVFLGVGLLYVAGLFVLPGRPDLSKLTGEEVRSVLLRANAIYFALGAVILGLCALVLMHRIAGPAFSLERALSALRQGDYGQGIKLRRRDHLKALARNVEELRLRLLAEQGERRELLAELESCLQRNDVDGARELVARLQGEPSPVAEPVEV